MTMLRTLPPALGALTRHFTRTLAGLTLALALPIDAAEYRDPGRVGRIVELQGEVALYDPEYGEWTEALRNRPLVAGDRLVLQRSARAELRVGATVLLLAQGADPEIDTLDDERLRLTLHDGALALRLDSRDDAEATEVRGAQALMRPQRAGRYRIDVDRESAFAATWRGALEVSGHGQLLLIDPGERHEVWRDDRGEARSRVARMPEDRLAAWADDRFDAEDAWQARRDERRYAPAGIAGMAELDRHGRWDRHPEYGAVWVPGGLPAGWAPFSDGRWIWMRPWGWTWVDARPWGFAPSHYGRWLQWGGRWCWWPGPRHQRAVFAPAVVAWGGSHGVSVGISIGTGPPVSWMPLPPWQPYVPIVVPRPPHHGDRPPHWRLPPPAPPLSRQPQPALAGGAGASTQIGRPLPPAAVRYGSDGLPAQVRPAVVPPAAVPPSAVPMPPAPPAAPAAPAAPVPPVSTVVPVLRPPAPAPEAAPRVDRDRPPAREEPAAAAPRPEPPRTPAPRERRDSREPREPREVQRAR